VDRTLSVNGETFTSQGQEVGLGFRGVTSLQVRDLGSKWTALVRKDSVARYNANGVVNMPFANGDVDTLYVIPNTPEGIQAAKNAARLISADTSGRRITRWLPDQDVDPAPGIQLATDYWDYEHFSRDRPDSALVAAMRGAHDSLMSEVGALLPLSRRVALVQVDSGITTSVRYAYEQYFGGMNVWGPAYAATLFQGWRATRSLEVAEYFPCVNQIMVLGSHWYGVGFRDDSGPLGGAVEVFVHGRESEGRAFLEPYFSFDTCSLTALGRSVFVMQALFGNRTLDLP
jgi:hypothetical protein